MGYSASLPGRFFPQFLSKYEFIISKLIIFFGFSLIKIQGYKEHPNHQAKPTASRYLISCLLRLPQEIYEKGRHREDRSIRKKLHFPTGKAYTARKQKNGYLKMKMTTIFEKDIFWYISQSISFSGVHRQQKASRSQQGDAFFLQRSVLPLVIPQAKSPLHIVIYFQPHPVAKFDGDVLVFFLDLFWGEFSKKLNVNFSKTKRVF